MYGFWIFMLVINLIIPLTMISFGRYFLIRPSKRNNGIFGYRTARSAMNEDTWAFAHHYCGRLWALSGALLLVFSPLAMVPVMEMNMDTVGLYGGILSLIQAAVLLGSVLVTERALKRTFDRDGNRMEDGPAV